MRIVISVVVPTYGRHKQLEAALRSVSRQDCPVPFEVIVVDDNPVDSELFGRNQAMLARRFPEVLHLPNPQSRGGAGARNGGVLAAKGAWVAFLDDDDEWLPDKLAQQWALMSGAPAGVVAIDTGFWEVDASSGQRKVVLPQLQGWIFDALLVKHQGRAPKLSTLVCRHQALLDVGLFDVALPSRQDLDLYLRLARVGRFESVLEPLALKHVHAGPRISTSFDNKLRGFEVYYHKYLAEFQARPVLHRIFLRQYARWLYRARRYPTALRLVLRSLWV